MKKHIYMILGFMGIIGTMAIGGVKANITFSEPYGKISYTLNRDDDNLFEAQVITISDGTTTITMLDRNLGAIAAGTGCEGMCDEGDDTYGYGFQWGNNYGFKCTGDVLSGTDKAIYSSIYSNNGYYGDRFIKSNSENGYDYWEDSIPNSPNHYNLRGGNLTGSLTDLFNEEGNLLINIWDRDREVMPEFVVGGNWKVLNAEDRQGPCPGGFHVPSMGERIKVLYIVDYTNYQRDKSGAWDKIRNGLLVPRQGYRDPIDGSVDSIGNNIALWSSSPWSYNGENDGPGVLHISEEGTLTLESRYRAGAAAVRCFYNYYSPYQFSFSLMSGDILLTGGRILPGEKLSEIVDFDSIDVMKDGFKFDGWFLSGAESSFDLETPITGDIVLYAQRSENKPSDGGNTAGGNSGGGGSRGGNNKNIEDRDFNNQNDDTLTGIDEIKNNNIKGNENNSNVTEQQRYSEESQQAYEFAYKNGITTMDSIDKADMEGTLTRIAMAKMLSQYAINVLGKKPADIAVPKFDDITENLNKDYEGAITQAYQLGIMGINIPNNKFRPFDLVPRSEFVTALSRLLYKTEDGKPYYKTHLDKLMKEGIITNNDYNMKELRGYVMIMLMRSVKD